MTPSQAAKSAMLGRTLHIDTSLFWKSHYIPCSPTLLILHNVTGSCKWSTSNNRLGLEKNIYTKSTRRAGSSLLEQLTYCRICGNSFSGSTDLHATQVHCKRFILRNNSVTERTGRKLTCLSFFVNCSKIVLKKRTGSSTRHLHTRRRATSITEDKAKHFILKGHISYSTSIIS